MSWRTVIISKRCKLDYKMGYMVVRDESVQRIYLEEVALLMIENPAVSFTGCLMEALTEKKIRVIFCDTKRNPVAELVPHHGSHNSSQRIRTQIGWSKETKALVWQMIICRKIKNQADYLKVLNKDRESELLLSYVDEVQPGDVTNREGHAAKVYFNALFGMRFTRGADLPVNAALNYGYGLLLSAINREVSAAGYLTQLGVFHNNMYNHFNLSSDLIEPFRIYVDRKVAGMKLKQFKTEEKHMLWPLLHDEITIACKKQTVLNGIRIYVNSVTEALNTNDLTKIVFPV